MVSLDHSSFGQLLWGWPHCPFECSEIGCCLHFLILPAYAYMYRLKVKTKRDLYICSIDIIELCNLSVIKIKHC